MGGRWAYRADAVTAELRLFHKEKGNEIALHEEKGNVLLANQCRRLLPTLVAGGSAS
jgi:hypothetical protein